MKFALSLVLGLALHLQSAFAIESFELNYSNNREHYSRLVLGMFFTCKTDANKEVSFEGGQIKDGEEVVIDFVDRFILANSYELPPLKVVQTDKLIVMTGVGGQSHMDYPNEIELVIVRQAEKQAKITARLAIPYTNEEKHYEWKCQDFYLSF